MLSGKTLCITVFSRAFNGKIPQKSLVGSLLRNSLSAFYPSCQGQITDDHCRRTPLSIAKPPPTRNSQTARRCTGLTSRPPPRPPPPTHTLVLLDRAVLQRRERGWPQAGGEASARREQVHRHLNPRVA